MQTVDRNAANESNGTWFASTFTILWTGTLNVRPCPAAANGHAFCPSDGPEANNPVRRLHLRWYSRRLSQPTLERESCHIYTALFLIRLQACGSIKSFKRLITPANKPQGFGFAEFEDPDGALRAIALLNNVELPALEDGCANKKLLVRLYVHSFISTYVEEFLDKTR